MPVLAIPALSAQWRHGEFVAKLLPPGFNCVCVCMCLIDFVCKRVEGCCCWWWMPPFGKKATVYLPYTTDKSLTESTISLCFPARRSSSIAFASPNMGHLRKPTAGTGYYLAMPAQPERPLAGPGCSGHFRLRTEPGGQQLGKHLHNSLGLSLHRCTAVVVTGASFCAVAVLIMRQELGIPLINPGAELVRTW